jgi:hypothetical protein
VQLFPEDAWPLYLSVCRGAYLFVPYTPGITTRFPAIHCHDAFLSDIHCSGAPTNGFRKLKILPGLSFNLGFYKLRLCVITTTIDNDKIPITNYQNSRVAIMPRVHKPSLAELAEIRETYIVEGDEETLEKITYQEQDVVKVFDRANNHEDLWAIHELRDVTAVDQQGKIVNLLFCARDGHNFTVQGQLFVDQEFVKYCKSSI